jgi:hypothetical protein
MSSIDGNALDVLVNYEIKIKSNLKNIIIKYNSVSLLTINKRINLIIKSIKTCTSKKKDLINEVNIYISYEFTEIKKVKKLNEN